MTLGLSAGGALVVGAIGGAYLSSRNKGGSSANVDATAGQQLELSKETLDWYKQNRIEDAPLRAAAEKRAQEVSDAQLMTMKQNADLSKEYADYNRGTFRPLEQGIVADANTYDSPERSAAKAAQAMSGVQSQLDNQQGVMERNLERKGVNPGSGAALMTKQGMATAAAASVAGAGTKSINDTEMQGHARMMDAASLGRNLPSNQATSAGVAINAGNSSVNSAGVPLSQSIQSAQLMGQGFSSAGSMLNSAGSLYAQAGQLQNTARAEDNKLLTSAANLYASDKNKKKNIKPVSDEQALAKIEKTPAYTWDYKPGEGDGGHHDGPMAQHVRKTMGEKAAPGGKAIDLVTLNGQNMAAIAALSRKVDKLAKGKKS